MPRALLFVAYSIYRDVELSGTQVTTYAPFILLFVALLIALAFEFVNGFHDTANAVATVPTIYQEIAFSVILAVCTVMTFRLAMSVVGIIGTL